MQRQTIATLAELRPGDRFNYMKRVDVWQVVKQTSGYTAVNQFMPWKQAVHMHDELKKNTTPVKFLRHTKPLPGDEAMLNDLTVGDVFYTNNDIMNEYTVIETGYPNVKCRCGDEIADCSNMEWVTVVSKVQEATA